MSERYCCVTWLELSQELKDTKEAEIMGTISEQGIPKSVFASVLKVLNSMALYCPVCGSGLTEETEKKEKIPPRKVPPSPPSSVPAPPQVSKIVCPKCKGREQAIKCNTCLGKGFLKPERKISDDKLARLEELKHKVVKPYDPEIEAQQMRELEEDD